jgi:hypothetical protein
MSGATIQWNRQFTLTVGKGGTGTMIKPPLKVEFEITKTIKHIPNVAKILVYNLAQDTEAKIKGEYDEVILSAGYEGSEQLIFRGNIRRQFSYRQDTDWILQIDAADGDKDYRNATIDVTFAAGTTVSQLIDHIAGKFNGGTTRGHMSFIDSAFLRGRTFSGMAREWLTKIADEAGAHWSIQDAKLIMVSATSTLPNEAIVINAQTGMLGAPEVTNDGIKVNCLLNPGILVAGKVWLDNNDLKARIAKEHEKKVSASGRPHPKKPPKTLARLDPDGIYKVNQIVHKGDTRGMEWVSEVLCEALQKSIPAGRRAA